MGKAEDETVDLTIVEALQRGISLQSQKLYDQAQTIYEKILEVDPHQPDALHLLGLIWSARGEHLKGAQYIREALQQMPANATYLGNLGVVLKFGGAIREAVEAYEQAIALEPRSSTHHFHLGKSLKAIERFEDAEKAFRKSIELDPNNESPWLSLIRTIADSQGSAAALPFAENAIGLHPKSAELRLSQASLLRRTGDYNSAIDAYRALLAAHPQHVEAMCKLASIAFSHHHFDIGRPYLERAQQLAPNSHHVLSTIALLQNTNGNTTESIRLYQQAIAMDDQIASYHANLATALRKQGRFNEALECIGKARTLDISSCDMDVVEGGVLLGLGEHDRAIGCLENAITQKDGYRQAHHALLMALQYRPGITSEELYREHQRWGQTYCPDDSPLPKANWDCVRPLRIGFVSADLGQHPVGYFTARCLESLDPNRFEVIVYSDRLSADPLSDRLAKSVKVWNRTEQWSDDQLLHTIRQNGIDILFDLAGHTAQNRLMVFARRGAPIQITWAGYVGTTGLDTIDYILADPHQISPEMEPYYSEKVLRMPHGYVTFFPPTDAPEVGPLPMDRNGYITFGAMCNPAKVNVQVVALWKEILTSVPNSRFLLCYSGWPDLGNQDRIAQQLADTELFRRFSFDYASGPTKTMDAYNRVDICLDTFPYSGGLTTCEAMYMGVPTVTLPGNTFAGRHSLSHLMNVGLQEMVAGTKEEYVGIAVSLAKDLPRLRATRLGLRDRVLGSPLCNGPLFAKDFGDLMLRVWKR